MIFLQRARTIIFCLLYFAISVPEAKGLWKKAKDTRRYFQSKKGKQPKAKSGDAAPDIEDDCDAMDEEPVDDDLNFLDENASTRFRETVSVGGTSTIGDDSVGPNDEEPTTSSNYSYVAKPKKKLRCDDDDTGAIEAAKMMSQTIASYFSKKDEEKSKDSGLKYEATWKQIESMYVHLKEDSIVDLNFLFISETHKAVVAERNSK